MRRRERAGRRVARSVLAVVLAASGPALATTIPPDLEARANELRRQASPQVLSWVHEQGVTLARASGPVDLGALEQKIRSQMTARPAPAGRTAGNVGATGRAGVTGDVGATRWAVLGSLNGADIEAVCFLVLMDASKSAQEDLTVIMAHVKAINNAKAQQRGAMQPLEKSAANALGPTPTPIPDRVAQLVSAARSLESRTIGAHLSTVVRR